MTTKKQELIKTIENLYTMKKNQQKFSTFYMAITEYKNKPTKEEQDLIKSRFNRKFYYRNEKYITSNAKIYQRVLLYSDFKDILGVSLSAGKFKPIKNLPAHQLRYIIFRLENPTEKDLEAN